MSHLSSVEALAAGVRATPEVAHSLAAAQAAWRFYANERIDLPQLAQPLLQCAKAQAPTACDRYALVVLDWSGLHLTDHASRGDRVELYSARDLGYELCTALALSDKDGRPLAPVALELKAKDGLYTTRSKEVLKASNHLDGLPAMMSHVCGLNLGKEPVFIIDREGDSVGHFRQFIADGRLFLVRANHTPRVIFEGQTLPLGQVADQLAARESLAAAGQGEVSFKGKTAQVFVGTAAVTITRPARTHRTTGTGAARQRRHKNIAGEAITVRLVVSEVRDSKGKTLARWLLLSNLPETIEAATVAQWYYWRWRIENYHKLMKGAGLQLEHWQQETAATYSRRLLVAAMAVTLVWQLAASTAPAAAETREILVRLSGRQMKRSTPFTIPALLAGLGILLPMLELLERHTPEELRAMVRASLGLAMPPSG